MVLCTHSSFALLLFSLHVSIFLAILVLGLAIGIYIYGQKLMEGSEVSLAPCCLEGTVETEEESARQEN